MTEKTIFRFDDEDHREGIVNINSQEYPVEIGLRLEKLEHGEDFDQYKKWFYWENVEPATFEIIAKHVKNIEHKRRYLGFLKMDEILKGKNTILVDRQTLRKSTTFVTQEGDLETIEYDDTYELYKIEGKAIFDDDNRRIPDFFYFLWFKDTSTDRMYQLWINENEVKELNNGKMDAIKAIAWSFTTNVPEGNVAELIRQGDCLIVGIKDNSIPLLKKSRSITEQEYRTLLTAES